MITSPCLSDRPRSSPAVGSLQWLSYPHLVSQLGNVKPLPRGCSGTEFKHPAFPLSAVSARLYSTQLCPVVLYTTVTLQLSFLQGCWRISIVLFSLSPSVKSLLVLMLLSVSREVISFSVPPGYLP